MISLNRIAPKQWLLIVLGVIVFIVLMSWPDDGWFPDSAGQRRAAALKAEREQQRQRDEFLTKCEHVWTRPVSQLTAEEVEMIGVCRSLKANLERH